VTTARDPEGRATVFDELPEELPRVVAVGRLDINTEGLLLLTNDGGLAKVIAHPDTGWLRRYRVRAHGVIDQARLDTIADGLVVDGMEYGPIEAKLDRVQGDNAWMTLGLREGKNREVKRILEHLGLRVNRLLRLSFGPFQLGDLPIGQVEEVRTRVLKDQLGDKLAAEANVDFASPVREPLPPEPEAPAWAQKGGRKPAESRAPEPGGGDKRFGGKAGGDRKFGEKKFGDKPGGKFGEKKSGGKPGESPAGPPRRPAWDRAVKASVWRADEAPDGPIFRKRRDADPKAAREASATRKHERVGAISPRSGNRVLVERVKADPADAPRSVPETGRGQTGRGRGGAVSAPGGARPAFGKQAASRPAGGRGFDKRAGEDTERAAYRDDRTGGKPPARGPGRPAGKFGERPGGRASGTRGESRGGRPFEKKPHQGRSSEDGPSGGRPAGAGGKPFGKPGDRPFGRAGGKPAGKPFGKPGGKPKGRPSGPSGRGPGRGPNKSPRS